MVYITECDENVKSLDDQETFIMYWFLISLSKEVWHVYGKYRKKIEQEAQLGLISWIWAIASLPTLLHVSKVHMYMCAYVIIYFSPHAHM